MICNHLGILTSQRTEEFITIPLLNSREHCLFEEDGGGGEGEGRGEGRGGGGEGEGRGEGRGGGGGGG